MGKIERFEDLKCWQASRRLARVVYTICEEGKLKSDFGTKDQFKRASLSAMNNIAEGFGRYNDKDFIRFLNYAQSSAAEVKSIIYLLDDMEYLEPEQIQTLHASVDETRSLTLGLIRYIHRKSPQNPTE